MPYYCTECLEPAQNIINDRYCRVCGTIVIVVEDEPVRMERHKRLNAAEQAVAKLRTVYAESLIHGILCIEGIPGSIIATLPLFGPQLGWKGKVDLCLADPAYAEEERIGCLVGKIGVVKRGRCTFVEKIQRVQKAGGVGVIVIQDGLIWPYRMTDSNLKCKQDAIPAFMISEMDGATVLQHMERKSCKASVQVNVMECSICQDEYENKTEVLQLPCQHGYHPECIKTWFQQNDTCPMCRYAMNANNPYVVPENDIGMLV